MSLIKSISGIRGTIGGKVGENLTPLDIVKFSVAYSIWLKNKYPDKQNLKVIVGRDARISGEMVSNIIVNTFCSMGIDVIDGGLSTTPTIEMAVIYQKADGGIIVTASHNPKQWNALKILNKKGEFINDKEGRELLEIASKEEEFVFSYIDDLGKVFKSDGFILEHIEDILKLSFVDTDKIRSKKLKIVVDAVNSTGGISVPILLKKLGVEVVELYCNPDGHFPHNPEPLEKNLAELSKKVTQENADLGIAVDPDVDRLVFIDEQGKIFGEEYTLVAVADFILENKKGAVVSNLSSSRALRDVAYKHGVECYYSAVGEVNVVEQMKKVNAIIGGEGNGGIIYPELHYGRDALVGIALFLTHFSNKNLKMSELRKSYPNYFMSKEKVDLDRNLDVNQILQNIKKKYSGEDVTDIDGVKIDFLDSWVHLRKSNTEPIVRIYTEAKTQYDADILAEKFISDIMNT